MMDRILAGNRKRSDSHLRLVLIGIAIGIFIFLFYFYFRSIWQSGDSITYAIAIRTGEDLFHPHHLLFNPIIRVLCIAQQTVPCDAILAGQVHNIFWAVVAILSMMFTLMKITNSLFIASFGSIFFIVSRWFWEYVTQNEVYVPAIGALTALFLLMFLFQSSGHKNRKTVHWIMAMAIIFAIAVFYHQSSVLFCIPFCIYFLEVRGRQGAKESLAAISLAGLIIFGVYWVIVYIETGYANLMDVLQFALTYSTNNDSWGNLSNFSFAGVVSMGISQLKNFSSSWVYMKWVGIPIMLAALIISMVQIVRKERGVLRRFLLAWWIVFSVFGLWWLPTEKEFFVISVWPLILLIAIALDDLRCVTKNSFWSNNFIKCTSAIFLISTTAINFGHVILPHHTNYSNDYSIANDFATLVSTDCLVASGFGVNANLRYYFGKDSTLNIYRVSGIFRDGNTEIVPDISKASGINCVLIQFDQVSPGSAINLNIEPDMYLLFLRWLSDFQPLYGSNEFVYRKPQVLTSDVSGGHYLKLGPEQRFAGTEEEWLLFLDQQAKNVSNEFALYSKWYEMNGK